MKLDQPATHPDCLLCSDSFRNTLWPLTLLLRLLAYLGGESSPKGVKILEVASCHDAGEHVQEAAALSLGTSPSIDNLAILLCFPRGRLAVSYSFGLPWYVCNCGYFTLAKLRPLLLMFAAELDAWRKHEALKESVMRMYGQVEDEAKHVDDPSPFCIPSLAPE